LGHQGFYLDYFYFLPTDFVPSADTAVADLGKLEHLTLFRDGRPGVVAVDGIAAPSRTRLLIGRPVSPKNCWMKGKILTEILPAVFQPFFWPIFVHFRVKIKFELFKKRLVF
jgi:hypothetical protein